MKDVVIIANFTQLAEEQGNSRFTYIANFLKDQYRVELLTSSFHHRLKKQRDRGCCSVRGEFIVTTVYEPGYSKNISLKRFYSHYIWGRNVDRFLREREKPDVVYCAIPSLTAALSAARYCKKNNIKFIIDVQDLWPEAFKMAFYVPVVSTLIFEPFRWLVNRIYKMADEVVAVSATYVKRALSVNRKCKSGNAIFLGTNLATYDECVVSEEPMYKKTNQKVWIGYCGTLAASYDIPNLIYASQKLLEKGICGFKLIIMGDGPHRQQFEAIANASDVDVVFTGRLPYGKMCAQMNECDIVVNPIKHGSAASIINKHGDYAASGLPVVNSQESQEYRNLIEEYHMGLNCKNEDAEDMAEKLEQLITNEALRLEMGRNARRCAEEKFDRQHIYKKIIDLIEG